MSLNMSTQMCPECGVRPPQPGYTHCSRECATGQPAPQPSAAPAAAPPTNNLQRFSSIYSQPAQSSTSLVSRTPSSKRKCPTCRKNPPTPGYKHCSRECALDLCPQCGVNPKNPGYEHCSRECALASQPAPAATPRKMIRTCEYCQKVPAEAPYRYCTSSCARKHAKEKALEESMSNMSLQQLRMCAIHGCQKTEWKAGSKYCGDRHRRQAVEKKLEPPCLLCKDFPKMERNAFCSATCAEAAAEEAPMLLEVPKDDPSFKLVAKQFANEWKHTPTPPNVAYVYLVVNTGTMNGPFQSKKQQIEQKHDYKSQGLLPANERLRWHGTKRDCFVGDPGPNALKMCSSSSCSICIIMKNSFDITKCKAGCMFGIGIYTSGTSSKSDGYVRQSTLLPSKYKAMLLTRVLAGNAQKLTQADPNLKGPPSGYDSIRGVPGGGVPGMSLNYDELIVYNNDQIRPLYLVIYDK